MDEEIRNLQLDKPGQGKSTIELQKHSIDDAAYQNKPIERSMLILAKGDDLQKLSVVGSLPDLLTYDNHGTVARVLPKLLQELPNSSSEVQLAFSRMFNVLIQMDVPINLINQVLQGIENKDPIIANAWMESLLSVIPILKDSIIKNEVLKCAISKSQITKTPYYRISSCKMIGKLSVHKSMSAFEVKKDILPVVQSLCQDCFYEVRAAICKELPCIAKGLQGLGENVVRVSLLPLLVELAADENILVRATTIDSVASTIPYLSSETIRGTIIPLTKKLCSRSVSEGDTTYISVAKVYKTLISNLQRYFTPNDAMWFLDYYIHVCKKGLAVISDDFDDPSISMICRESCAFSLPIIANLLQNQLPDEIENKWYLTFKDLAADPCYIVRKAVASCLPEVIKTLGQENKLIMLDVTKLLRDEDEEVLQALVPNIGIILELFAIYGLLPREAPVHSTLEVGRALLKCQVEVFKLNSWRMKELLLKQLERLPCCMPSDFIHQHFTPVILKATLNGKAKPVRSQATRTLLIILRYNLKENHRKWIRENIIIQLCNSNCCYTRQIFVMLCINATAVFSWRYFKEHFYLHILALAEDPVSNVRLSVVNFCPTLKQMLVLPLDRPLQLRLENILSKLEMIESDKDVLLTLKMKLKEMRSFQVNKNDVLVEEKRKIEEEESILKGKIPLKSLLSTDLEFNVDNIKNIDQTQPVTLSRATSFKSPAKTKSINTNNMSFLDQHFYIDAGINISPEIIENNAILNKPDTTEHETQLAACLENVSLISDEINKLNNSENYNDIVISAETVNMEHLPVDIKALETTTTNITDDVKVSIKNKSEFELKRRVKRSSCVFTGELKVNRDSSFLKRRSLHIGAQDVSKIPVCSRISKKLSKSEQLVGTNKPHASSRENVEKQSESQMDQQDKAIPSKGNKKNTKSLSNSKASSLPVLVSRKSDRR